MSRSGDALGGHDLMPLPIVHHRSFAAVLPVGHRFPMAKFASLADLLASERLVARGAFHEPPAPASREWLGLVHEAAYVAEILGGNVEPAIEREIGLPL